MTPPSKTPGQRAALPDATPTVAVMIAAFNAEAFVQRAVRSALAQPEVSEVWIIDDASQDRTADVAQACDDGSGRLRVRRQAINRGPAAARNVALAGTRAHWICVVDADDYLMPGRIARLLQYSDGSELLADHLIRVDEAADHIPVRLPASSAPAEIISLVDFLRGNVSRKSLYRQELGFVKPLMEINFLRRHEIAYHPDMRLGEDYDLYARILAAGGRMTLAPACGYVAVVRQGSLSGRHTITDLQTLRDCDDRLARTTVLSKSERRALDAHRVSVDSRLQWRRLIEAVKTRDWRSAASTFRSVRVSLVLTRNLIEQAWIRTFRSKDRARGA